MRKTTKTPKSCQHCKVMFVRPRIPADRWARTKFCSYDCANAHKRPPMRPCAHCGETRQIRPGRLHCSQSCANHSRGINPKTTRYRTITVNGVKMHEHRWVLEQKLGRPLRPGEVTHHKNHDKLDNRPENLEVMTASEHGRLHAYAS